MLSFPKLSFINFRNLQTSELLVALIYTHFDISVDNAKVVQVLDSLASLGENLRCMLDAQGRRRELYGTELEAKIMFLHSRRA